jgi:membrane associated rhomboid family serine protease
VPETGWVDLPAHLPATLRAPRGRAKMNEWALVLEARGVPHRRQLPGRRPTLRVPAGMLDRAVAEVQAYELENPAGRQQVRAPASRDPRPALAGLLLLVGFYAISHTPWPSLGIYPHHWNACGAADAQAVMQGQWWRLVTGLTLHADPSHVLGNAGIGGTFLLVLAARIGPGPAWLLTLGAGILGNLLNAWLMGPGHLSIGFSTAVFGTAGVLAGSGLLDAGGGRAWLRSLGAGLGLLALLGFGGENTDIGAHVLGFVAGLGLGAGLRVLEPGKLAPGPVADAWTAGGALLLTVWAWLRALDACLA